MPGEVGGGVARDKKPSPSGRSRSKLLIRCLISAIAVLIAFHWHLAVTHIRSTDERSHAGGSATAWSHKLSGKLPSSQSKGRRKTGREQHKSHHQPQPSTPLRRPRYDDAPHTSSNTNSSPYESSVMCLECSRAIWNRKGNKHKCADYFQRRAKTGGGDEWEAARQLAAGRKACQVCDPDKCYEKAAVAEAMREVSSRGGMIGNEANATAKNLTNGTTRDNGGGGRSTNKFRTKYWRFDHAAPAFSIGSTPKSLVLPSIPPERRLPPSRFNDVSAYFHEKYASHPMGGDAGIDFLFEYNPGLVRLPPKLREGLPPEAAYLVSLRVTPANNCFAESVYSGLDKAVWDAVYRTTKNHLGLALLDVDLNVLPGHDVVIQLDKHLGLETSTERGEFGPPIMDYRLFVLGSEGEEQIYLHANADTVVVAPIRLSAKGYGDNDEWENAKLHSDGLKYMNFIRLDKPLHLKSLYGGDNLRVTLLHDFNTIWSGGVYGKNYALFEAYDDETSKTKSVYAEVLITPKHVTHRISPDKHDLISLEQVFEYIWKPGTTRRRFNPIDRLNRRSVVTPPDVNSSRFESNATRAPKSSFSTVDTLWFNNEEVFKESAHGGACCIPFTRDELGMDDNAGVGDGKGKGENDDNNRGGGDETFLVGVAHTKVAWRKHYSNGRMSQEEKDAVPHTHYVSFFYTFRPYPPFDLVARSGYFCLGFGDRPDELVANPYMSLGRNRLLRQHNETFNCPQIHYISAFVEKAGDPTRTVVGYGLNDCTARLVEVDKAEIGRMLFPEPMDMVYDLVK